MHPTIELGPVQISTYYLVYGVAITLAGMLSFHRLRRGGGAASRAIEGICVTVIAGLGGATLVYALVKLVAGHFAGPVAPPFQGGSTIFGAILGGGIAGTVYGRWRKVRLGRAWDLGIVPIPLGQAIGRLGCLLGGCCYGKPTGSWLGMSLPGPGGHWALRYPTQILSSGADLLIFLALLSFERCRARRLPDREGWPFHGFLTLMYGELYFAKRFIMEFLRDERPVVLPPFTWAHVLSLAGLLLATSLILLNLHRTGRLALRSGSGS